MHRDTENAELDDADFARAKPFREVFPDPHQSWKRLSRPPLDRPERPVADDPAAKPPATSD